MIRHVVSWKLAATDEAQRSSDFDEIAAALRALPDDIPAILALTVGRNVAYHEKNFDVVLIVDLASVEQLDVYQTHPSHLRAAGVVGPRVSARACVDFELDG